MIYMIFIRIIISHAIFSWIWHIIGVYNILFYYQLCVIGYIIILLSYQILLLATKHGLKSSTFDSGFKICLSFSKIYLMNTTRSMVSNHIWLVSFSSYSKNVSNFFNTLKSFIKWDFFLMLKNYKCFIKIMSNKPLILLIEKSIELKRSLESNYETIISVF